MLKKLKLSAALIIVGELLSWTQNYFASDATSNFSELPLVFYLDFLLV